MDTPTETEEVDDVELEKQLDAVQAAMLNQPSPQAPPSFDSIPAQLQQALAGAMHGPAHPYVLVLKALRGYPAILEVANEARPAPEVVKGIVWDLFDSNELLLVITNSDIHDPKPDDVRKAEADAYSVANAQAQAAGAAGKPVPVPTTSYLIRTWQFKWVLTRNVIAVQQEAMIAVNHDLRKVIHAKYEPLYNDGKSSWQLINNYVAIQINEKLKALGFNSTFNGPLRTAENVTVELDKAEYLGKK